MLLYFLSRNFHCGTRVFKKCGKNPGNTESSSFRWALIGRLIAVLLVASAALLGSQYQG